MAGLDDKAVDLDPKFEALLAGADGAALGLVFTVQALETMAAAALGPKAREFALRQAMIGKRALELHHPGLYARAMDMKAKARRDELTVFEGGRS